MKAWTLSFPLQSGVDHGLPTHFNCARSPDPSINHFLCWLSHRRNGGDGLIAVIVPRFIDIVCAAMFCSYRPRHALDHVAHFSSKAATLTWVRARAHAPASQTDQKEGLRRSARRWHLRYPSLHVRWLRLAGIGGS